MVSNSVWFALQIATWLLATCALHKARDKEDKEGNEGVKMNWRCKSEAKSMSVIDLPYNTAPDPARSTIV
jgi:hypothetical protein